MNMYGTILPVTSATDIYVRIDLTSLDIGLCDLLGCSDIRSRMCECWCSISNEIGMLR